ncbi:MAG: flagellar hook protein FlgE [bacterium]|nr:flagellar hook protein FlgE [bacterium]
MAIFGALSSGRSGLIVNGAALSVIGNNIANVGTVGFKGSRTEFADLISAEAGGQVGKIGLGARIGAVRTLFEQGAIEATGRSLDLAIEGQGFFVLREGQAQIFTRAGNFQKNADGTITNSLGHVLQGTPVDATGRPIGGLQDVNVSGLQSQANPTSLVNLSGNLDSTTSASTFDGTSFTTAFNTSSYSTSIQVFDSLGSPHDMTVFFTKTGANSWQVNLAVDAGDTGGTAGNIQLINGAGGTITFNTDGTVNTTGSLTGNVTFSGAAAQSIAVDLDDFTQVAGPSGLNAVRQDGFGAGGLVSLTVNSVGVLSATFDNGQTRPLFQLAVASFRNPEGLIPAGNQLFRASIDSGPPAVATAQSQGNGSVLASALEQSNVQIAQEFIDLISTQRAFQANARVITASDQLLGDLINIVR